MKKINPEFELASSITKAASKQTYYTIQFLADRDRMADAYRAYAYFRWVDDVLDGETDLRAERSAFIQRQRSLLESCYCRNSMEDTTIQEQMLVELVQQDVEKKSAHRQAQDSGLQMYLRNMMSVMAFDADRRGRIVSQVELNEYTRWLASAVTEAMHYFIGHGCDSPQVEARYMAVSAAHIIHMLRDTYDDIQAGYFNIPCEVLDANHIKPQDIQSDAYRAWVQGRVNLARKYFEAGREYLSQVENSRCRLAGFMYTARFEWLLDTFEREGYRLRPRYEERKSFATGLRMSLSTLSSMMNLSGNNKKAPTFRKHSLKES